MRSGRLPLGLLSAVILVLFSAIGMEATPAVIAYRGRLLDATGNVANSAGLPMKFLVWSDLTGGSLLYQDWHDGSDTEHALVAVTDGLYNVTIGADSVNRGDALYTTLDAALNRDDGAVYLEILIDGTTLSPREAVYPTPYALRAGSANVARAARELNNVLNPTVAVALLPATTTTLDLGSSANSWNDLYAKTGVGDGAVSVPIASMATINATGTLTNKTFNPAANAIVLSAGAMLIGGATGVAAGQAISGAVTLGTAGVATLADVPTDAFAANAVTLAKIAVSAPNNVMTSDSSGNGQWESEGVFQTPSLPNGRLFVGDAADSVAFAANLPSAAMPVGGAWTLTDTLRVAGATLVLDRTNDRVGVGVGTPTAALHLKAGSASANGAPLKFTAGTNLAATDSGAFEYDGQALRFTSAAGRAPIGTSISPPIDSGTFTFFFDEFDAASATSNDWTQSNSGTGATSAPIDAVAGENAHGVIYLTTGTATTGRASLYRYTDAWLCGQGTLVFEARIKFPVLSASTDNYSFVVGLHDSTSRDGRDGVYFLYNRASYVGTTEQNLRCVTANNNTRTITDSGFAVTANAWITCKVVVNAAGTQARFYIDDVLRATHTANIPTATGRATGPRFQIIKTAGTNERTAQIDYWAHYMNLPTTREQ